MGGESSLQPRPSDYKLTLFHSPIVTWLPNQLFAVMDLMTSVWDCIAEEDKAEQPKFVFDMMANVEDQKVNLSREVERWCQERGV